MTTTTKASKSLVWLSFAAVWFLLLQQRRHGVVEAAPDFGLRRFRPTFRGTATPPSVVAATTTTTTTHHHHGSAAFNNVLPRMQKRSSQTQVSTTLSYRGGNSNNSACQANPWLCLQVAASAVVETLTMLGALKLGDWLAIKFPKQPTFSWGPTLSQFLAAASITLGSSVFGALADGGLSTVATQQVKTPTVTPGDTTWYAQLRKPGWNPPGWLFPIMWLVIVKPTQAAAVARILHVVSKTFKNGTAAMATTFPWRPLATFCTHLALGDAWNKVFFGFQCPGRGAGVISVFYGVLLVSMRWFSVLDKWAGRLLWPSGAWISIATALNWSIYFLNK